MKIIKFIISIIILIVLILVFINPNYYIELAQSKIIVNKINQYEDDKNIYIDLNIINISVFNNTFNHITSTCNCTDIEYDDLEFSPLSKKSIRLIIDKVKLKKNQSDYVIIFFMKNNKEFRYFIYVEKDNN